MPGSGTEWDTVGARAGLARPASRERPRSSGRCSLLLTAAANCCSLDGMLSGAWSLSQIYRDLPRGMWARAGF